jgi:hypothetical protein
MEVEETIKKLESLNLKVYPINDIYRHITSFGEFGSIIVNYNPGKVIMRARPLRDDETVLKVADLSYKPAEKNLTYQRASIPFRSVFYGCTISENEEDKELMNNRVIGVFESTPWLRDKTRKGVQKIAFGRWVVNQTLNLVAVVNKEDFYNSNSYTRELVDGFKEYIHSYPDFKKKTLLVSGFLANEFGKSNITDDSDYLISAIYTDIVISNGFDGVLYPSVRLDGRGFNVAISPLSVRNKLRLEVAGECIIYKFYDRMVMDNLTITSIPEGADEFTLHPVEAPYHAGRDNCLIELGLESISDLYD